jgi:FMN phosphatase YigB (HAD superfamily)
MSRIGRPTTESEISDVLSAIAAANGEEDRLDSPGMDTDAALHRSIAIHVYRDAGLEESLCEALYAVDADPEFNLFADDVHSTLQEPRERDIAVAVVSDIHFDIRPLFHGAGCGDLVDVYTLSFEQGVQKPAPEMFTRTLAALDVDADQALMVGDRSRPDGAAVELGLTTLLLPPLARSSDRRLHRVLALCS